MPLRRNNQRVFHRTLLGGITETVRIYKRKDNQQQGQVTVYLMHQCWRTAIIKTGETLQGDMNASHYCVWHIPRVEMERLGIHYFNPLDRIEQIEPTEEAGWWWQSEATTEITVKLFGNHYDLACLRVDPPTNVTPHG